MRDYMVLAYDWRGDDLVTILWAIPGAARSTPFGARLSSAYRLMTRWRSLDDLLEVAQQGQRHGMLSQR